MSAIQNIRTSFERAYLGKSVAFVFLPLLRTRRLFKVKVLGVPLWVRSRTPDLLVALETLRKEYSDFFRLKPSLPGGLIIDAGAYIGTAAIAFARQYPAATIVAIEPDAENFDLLEKNTRNWPNIRCIHAALTASPGRIPVFDTGKGDWGFSIMSERDIGRPVRNEVDGITVSEVMARFGFDRVAILKLDIEGAERDVLNASAEWMARTETVFAELHEHFTPGCDDAWAQAIAGRRNGKLPGEKVYSFAS